MWSNQFPFFPLYLPFAGPQWPPFVHSYPYPPLPGLIPETISDNEKPRPFSETVIAESEVKMEERPESMASPRFQRKVYKSQPIKKKQKEDSFDKKKQKKDRNLPSNVCRFFVSFVYKHSSLQNIFGISKQTNCIREMKKYIKENQVYIRPGLIERMCKGLVLGAEQSRCFRMLFNRFIKVEFRMLISLMRKLRKKEKLAYFKLGNKFLRQFVGCN